MLELRGLWKNVFYSIFLTQNDEAKSLFFLCMSWVGFSAIYDSPCGFLCSVSSQNIWWHRFGSHPVSDIVWFSNMIYMCWIILAWCVIHLESVTVYPLLRTVLSNCGSKWMMFLPPHMNQYYNNDCNHKSQYFHLPNIDGKYWGSSPNFLCWYWVLTTGEEEFTIMMIMRAAKRSPAIVVFTTPT